MSEMREREGTTKSVYSLRVFGKRVSLLKVKVSLNKPDLYFPSFKEL